MHLKNLEFEEKVQKLMFDELKISSIQERDIDVSLLVFPGSKVTVNYGRCSVQIQGGQYVFRNVFLRSCSKIIIYEKNGNCMYDIK